MLESESEEQLRGRFLGEFLSEGHSTWEKIVWLLDKEGVVRRHEVGIKLGEKKSLQAEISARYVELAQGKFVVAFIEDITDRKVIQEQMAEAKSESEFLTDLLAHDITNFMTTSLYFLSSMYDAPSLADEEKRKLRMVLKDIQGAFDLSTAVRDLSRARSLSADDIGASDLHAILASSIDDAKRMYPNKSIQIRYERGAEPRFVQGSALLARLFSNLISNSIKFDPSDSVTVEIGVDAVEDKGTQFWRITISDNGVGIPDSEKERVFERFHRLDQSIAGTGLGLYAARFIATACGGKVWAENRVEKDHTKGTKMVVLLKKSKERDIAQASKRSQALKIS
jgi:signal transduction histidine kinase